MVEGVLVNNDWGLWNRMGPATMPPEKLSKSPQATVAAHHPQKALPIGSNLVSGFATVTKHESLGICRDHHGSSNAKWERNKLIKTSSHWRHVCWPLIATKKAIHKLGEFVAVVGRLSKSVRHIAVRKS